MAGISSVKAAGRPDRRATDRYVPLLALGFAGYVLFGKSFAYLGVPPVFIGEILLCLGILALLASGSAVTLLATLPAISAALLMGWVLLRTLQGLGSYKVNALRDGAVALYAGFAFIVAALLVEKPARLATVVGYFRIHARVLIPIAIAAYLVARFAGTSLPKLPGQDVEIVSVRSGELAAHLCGALVLVLVGLCRVGRVWLVVCVGAALLIASQSRGGMLALMLPLIVAMVFTGQLRRFVAMGGLVALVMGAAYVADIEIDLPRGERPISARAVVDNIASIAASSDANNLDGTKQWRLSWWEAIRNYTFHGPYFWTGKGFGVNLAEADGFVVGLERGGPTLRSPHSVHMTYLARGGVPGLALWLMTFASWMAALLRAARLAWRCGDRDWSRYFVFLVCYLAAIIIDASFDVALEGPMLGIPFWILFGIGLGSLMIYRGLPVVEMTAASRAKRRAGAGIGGAALLLAAGHLGGGPAEAAEGSCPASAIPVPVGASIPALVAKAPPGATFCIAAGIHRAQLIVPKDGQVFIGEPGAVLTGAEPITGLRQQGRFWIGSAARPGLPPFGTCLRSRPRCNDPERFFLDDEPLEPVATLADLGKGMVFRDASSDRFYLAQDPGGRRLEHTRQPYAFRNDGARRVTVRGLIVEKYATPAQQGAIFGDENPRATDWLIENNEVRLNSGSGIATGERSIVRGNKVHHNGQLGISPNGADVVIEDNEIYANNILGFDAAWEAGGVKAGAVERLTLRRNHVHDNFGSGLWCDVDCRDILIEDNRVERNADAGIFYEISFGAVIRNNIVRFNGTGRGGQQGSAWIWGAGIQIAASEGVEVYGNSVTVAEGGAGIVLVDQARERIGRPAAGAGAGKLLYRTVGNAVHDNEIIYDGEAGISGGASDVARSNPNFGIIETGGNRFDRNTYVLRRAAASPAFAWGDAVVSYERFRNLGQETNGHLVRPK
ncbi:right-handed parallel beta-helix repeat-containing protein [Bosea sp. (in: a-proteobacteria)]|uniref:right-handed parallel beta-helix repeat-containing protein n=1 Tax=Bosea sp. (in: a-proteobacteria) TaxID=1871050 RepID=UPI002627D82E|nr:right-handed parallel beta-helix repeat-containing protein [Bosea sp. (in: a-proteobacteria)]MCO5090982.1 right-handed parallel beta-helix repeat-containing protein [Bosea sp. (in: a-proteobacteria)]